MRIDTDRVTVFAAQRFTTLCSSTSLDDDPDISEQLAPLLKSLT